MSKTPLIAGGFICALGLAAALVAPLDLIGGFMYTRDDRPLVLPSSELPRKEAVIALLRERRYDELEKTYRLTLAADQQSATDTLDRFDAFAYADPELQERLDGWVAAQQSSPLPLLARGAYFLHLAYVVRGDGFRSETSSGQFEEMRKYMNLAGEDFQRAREIGPPSVAAFQGLIDIAITTGERRSAAATLEQALAATDNPAPLHITFMRALEPKWGGARGATSDYWHRLRLGGTLRHSDEYLDFVGILLKADEACSKNDCESAVAYHEDALDVLPNRKGMYGHARALAGLERYEEALDVLEAGLQRDPDQAAHYELKAIILAAMERREEAAAAIRDALRLDPYNTNMLVISQEILSQLSMAKTLSDDAAGAEIYDQQWFRDVERAVVYGASRGNVQEAWARAIMGRGGPHEEAFAAFEEAIRLSPKEPRYVLSYGSALASVGNCKALEVYRSFGQMCKRGGFCDRYISLKIFTDPLEEQCENPAKAQIKRMRPSTLAQMEACGSHYAELPRERALERCTARAEAGDISAAFDLGVIHAYGYGTTVDQSLAIHWFEVAAEAGHIKAKGAFGHFLYQGNGAEKDTVRGKKLIEEAAEQGDIAAMIALGFIYYDERSGEQNLQESLRWFSKAADLGSEEAQGTIRRFFPDQASGG